MKAAPCLHTAIASPGCPSKSSTVKPTKPRKLCAASLSRPLNSPLDVGAVSCSSGPVLQAPCFKGRAVDIRPLRELAEWRSQYHNTRPVVIQIEPPVLDKEYGTFFHRLSPAGLLASPMVDAPLSVANGLTAEGQSRAMSTATLRDFLAPLETARLSGTPVDGFAYAPLPINDSPRLSIPKSPLENRRPWWDYIASTEPAWPKELLFYRDGDPEPHYNTSVILGVGKGEGSPFHFHGPNLFLQVHGRKKWSLYSPQEFAPYLRPNATEKFMGLTETAPEWSKAMNQEFFDPIAFPSVPPPYEFITDPGQMAYLPCGWMHRVSNLDDYTVSYARVVTDRPPDDIGKLTK